MSDCNQMYGRSMMQRGGSYGNCSCKNSRTAQYQTGYGSSCCHSQNRGANYGGKKPDSCGLAECDQLSDLSLAMGYVPWQQWCSLYEPDKGLCQGTVFAELDKPFLGCRGGRR